jgi:hypothetical protein
MSKADSTKSLLLHQNLSKEDILALDPKLFSAEDKKAYIALLYGQPDEWTWKRNLQSAASNIRRWKLLLNEEAALGQQYRVRHKKLLDLATLYPPKLVGQTVTDFTDWIFRLYIPEREYSSLLRGQSLEREIAVRRIPIPSHSGWKPIFDGTGNSNSSALPISELAINGIPLRGKPDLVFCEKATKRILIVELKTSEAEIPSNGWPNMSAQLWAYSKIDKWRDAKEILLVGEVWGFRNGLRLRKVLHWNNRDQTLERENAELFDCYRTYCETLANLSNT